MGPQSIEGIRCEAVHEAVNKFVVYEKFAEMTHKYDVQNFGKLLDDYSTSEEIAIIRKHLTLDPPSIDNSPLSQSELEEESKTPKHESEENSSPSTLLQENSNAAAPIYRFHFVQYQQTTSSTGLNRGTAIQVDVSQVPREDLTPPKEKLA